MRGLGPDLDSPAFSRSDPDSRFHRGQSMKKVAIQDLTPTISTMSTTRLALAVSVLLFLLLPAANYAQTGRVEPAPHNRTEGADAVQAFASELAHEAPAVDAHQHLFSPAVAAMVSTPAAPFAPISAADVIALLDAAGIRRGVVLSVAYMFGSPARNVPDEYEKVKAENDWTSAQVAMYPERLVAFCGINPLRDYALREIARCAQDPRLRKGLKLHFGNSVIDYHDPEHIARLRRVFRAANDHHMAIVVHMRASISQKKAYGADEARIFLNELLPQAPGVTVQIAHLAGAGTYSESVVDEALQVFIDAIRKKDRRMRHVIFDVTGIAGLNVPGDRPDLAAQRIRELGVARVVYGSDAAAGGNPAPKQAWDAFCELPLTPAEIRTIARNVPDYLR
jgi:predicted TIM-barrel fold metal-dependent hydrolase